MHKTDASLQANASSVSVWSRVWHSAQDANSIAGFLLGFLIVLIILTCCSCTSYIAYLIYRYQCQRYLEYRRTSSNVVAVAGQLNESLDADTQNADNLARQAKIEAASRVSQSANQPTQQQHHRLHSILKNPRNCSPGPRSRRRKCRPANRWAASPSSVALCRAAY